MTSTPTSAGGGWQPQQYERFRDERSQPFYALAALVSRRPAMRVIDLGCGTGELTAWLHRELGAAETLGIDASAEMLARSTAFAGDGVRFEQAEVTALDPGARGAYDLVFSNATLHWVTEHEALFPRLLGLLRPGGQLAVQMPANGRQPSHFLDREVAAAEPYASALGGWVREDPVQEPEWYAALLHQCRVAEQRVRVEVYGHALPSSRAVVQWVDGALLTPYRERLPAELYTRFVREYEARLIDTVGDQAPYFWPFRRIFLWARLPEA